MMDTAKLLAELDASDATLAGVSALYTSHWAVILEIKHRNQQLREALARIADLEAVVVPLERLVKAGFVNCFATKKNYAVGFNLLDAKGVTVYRDTLAEALAAAVKAMEDAT